MNRQRLPNETLDDYIERIVGFRCEIDTTYLSGEWNEMLLKSFRKLSAEARRWSKDGKIILL